MAFPSTALINLNELADGGEEKIEDSAVGEELKSVELLRSSNSQLMRGPEVVEEEEDGGKTPQRYVPLCDVYSATSPYVSSISGGSKKVKPPHLLHHRKSVNHLNGFDCSDNDTTSLSSTNGTMDGVIRESNGIVENKSNAGCCKAKPIITKVYSRRCKGKVHAKVIEVKTEDEENVQNLRSRAVNFGADKGKDVEEVGIEKEVDELVPKKVKRRKVGGYELTNLGVDSVEPSNLDSLQFREPRKTYASSGKSPSKNFYPAETNGVVNSGKKKMHNKKSDLESKVKNLGSFKMKRWIRLSFDGADPDKFVGLRCKVFWPLDADWYTGEVLAYDFKTGRHHVKYEDGDEEDLILSNEKTKFHISLEEMQLSKLRSSDNCSNGDGIDVNELMVLAASLDDCGELEPGEIIWAKLTGYAMWPALILDDSLVGDRKGLSQTSGEKSALVQFFGTHDFARVKKKQAMPFLRGLLSSFHLKSKKANFFRSLEEAKLYLREQQLPARMLKLRNGFQADDCNGESGEDEVSTDSEKEAAGNKEIQRRIEAVKSFTFEVGDLQIVKLGKVVKDSYNFQDDKFIWPEGYTALRRFFSIADPNLLITYKMEVCRDDILRSRPVFKVTSENGEQFSGSTPSACWNKIYRRLRKAESEGIKASVPEKILESGADMFGFSHPEISKLIKELASSTCRPPSKAHKMSRARYQDFPVGYRPVDVKWRDLDKCNVCHMDEEYENNLFLQCDKCRIMVHARCYGESDSMDGVVWLCNLCRPGAPEHPPPCCLCPITGGAMKPTTDGRWAHLACAIWIPETCLFDITKMEPIDGLSRINKDRWKLLCSICGVSFGACIQCSNHTCRVAYHPLCARAAGFCVELEDEDGLHLISPDEDDDDQCIRLLSFCKRHRPVSNDSSIAEDRSGQGTFEYSDYSPPINPSGCARAEPYNFERRGRKEPEALAAASLKRLYVENRQHLVGGFSQHDCFGARFSALVGSRFSADLNLKTSHLDASRGILSVAEKYRYMRETVRKRLAFGKSGIHGFGIFAKQPHRAGDMVIEYTGELVRPSIADRREHLIYNSLVGAGTYMFRIDDERVIDATRAGSIAHLINHSCEPNCYSRTISVNGDEHIIIFAKRDLKQWEELTYDYRFYAIDEQLACYCGFPRCRGVVNDPEAKERVGKLYVQPCELIDWKGE